ncbi:hypothetical protein ACP4OV_027856 [Aristida adscensionis]
MAWRRSLATVEVSAELGGEGMARRRSSAAGEVGNELQRERRGAAGSRAQWRRGTIATTAGSDKHGIDVAGDSRAWRRWQSQTAAGSSESDTGHLAQSATRGLL